MEKIKDAANLVGIINLDGFKIIIMTEVFMTDTDGRKTKSLGYFVSENVAKAYAENQVDSSYYKTRNAVVLTDGTSSFLLGESIEILSDEQASLEVREKALAKLSEAERKVLGV